MNEMRNRQWLIAARPVGRDVVESDFAYREATVRAPGAGEACSSARVMAPGVSTGRCGGGGYSRRAWVRRLVNELLG